MDVWNDRESRRQSEQHRLEMLLGNKGKNRLGQFATPPSLALEVMQYLCKLWPKSEETIRFLEPAIGTGAFYSALCRVFPERNVTEAVGIEVDSNYARSAISIWEGTRIQVIESDFTRRKAPDPDGRFNLIATNPPYVRHHHLSQADKVRLKEKVLGQVGIGINGLAGFYCYYLLLADEWLAEGGISAWLIPSEFMDVKYGLAVKHYLTTNVKLLHIHRFCPDDVQFSDALVSSAVVIFEKSPPSTNSRVTFSYGGSLLQPQLVREVPMTSLRALDKWNKYAMFGTGNGEEGIGRHGPTLGDLFTIKRGLATGDNHFFILEREQANRLGIPGEFLKPILPNPRALSTDVVSGDENGFPQITPHRVLLDCNLPENEVRRRFPEFWKYLESGKTRKIDKGYITSRRSPWYSQEKRPPPPFLCTYMGRMNNGNKPFRFIWNRSQATAHNVYLLLYPKPFLKEALRSNPQLERRLFAALRKIDTNRFTSEGRVYGGGLYKMEPKELAQISSECLSAFFGRLSRKKVGLNPRNGSLF